MKEAYAVRRTVPPSAEIEARIEHMLSVGVGENPRESLSELARLGARLIIQRAVEDGETTWPTDSSLRSPESKAFYDRKRAEGKRHNAALICLARRRCNVIHAMLRTGQPYNPNHAADLPEAA